MRIRDLAEQAGVTPATIRYYEQIGVLPPPERADNGYRAYDEADVERLRFVVQARALDFSLDEIREILAFRERGLAPCAYVLGQIDRKVAEIDRRIADLNQLRCDLRQMQFAAEQLPQADIEADDCVCRLIENRPFAIDAGEITAS